MNNQTVNKILIIHNHSLYAQTVARAVRALNIYCELIFDPKDVDAIKALNPKGVVFICDSENSTHYASLEIPLLTLNHQTAFSQATTQSLTKFLQAISTLEANWTTHVIIDHHIRDIKEKVGSDEVILALSGGVDSSVVAALLHKAIGKQLTCIFVDTGLMRLNEGDYVMRIFTENMGVKVIRINAEARFLEALKGEADPENKRKIIGKLFIDIFEEESKKLNNASWLAQGTIYPDILESMSAKDGSGVSIKSHHNVGGLPPEMNLKLIEPLSDLFKDEVRKLGTALGLPPEMVYRHPFPGPGLGVRILGAITKEYADILRAADAIFIEELRKANLYDMVSQAFVVFIPVKSVGIQKGERHYNYVISLRAIETIDFVVARAAHLPFEFIEQVSNRIILEVEGVSRVVYDVSNKPPATIEWE